MYFLMVFGFIFWILGITLFILLYQKKRNKVALRTVVYFLCSLAASFSFQLIAYLAVYGRIELYQVSEAWKYATDMFGFRFGISETVNLAMKNENHAFSAFGSFCYNVGYVLSFIACAFTSISAVAAIILHFFGNHFRVKFALRKEADIYVDGDIDNDAYIEDLKKNKRPYVLLFTKAPSDEDQKTLYENRVPFLICSSFSSTMKVIYKAKMKAKTRSPIVYFKKEEEDRLHFLTQYIEWCKEAKKMKLFMGKVESIQKNLPVFISFTTDNLASIDDIFGEDIIASNIRIFNKYELLAENFEMKYPFTHVLEKEDVVDGCIQENLETKMIFIGFGKVNQEVFKAAVINNQFVKYDSKKKKIVPAPLTFYSFDKENQVGTHKGITYLYKRFSSKEGDFPQADAPYIVGTQSILDSGNAFSSTFIQELFSILRPSSSEKEVRAQILISCNEDLEDFDLAMKLYRLFLMHPLLLKHVKIYLRLKKEDLIKKVEEAGILYPFGGENILTHDFIVDSSLEFMQDTAHLLYDKYSPEVGFSTFKLWKEREPIQLRRNAYEAINDIFKLSLLGYTMEFKKQEGNVDSIEKFLSYLSKKEEELLPYLNEKHHVKDDSSLQKITRDYVSFLLKEEHDRKHPHFALYALTYQEKLRWNAFLIMNGYAMMDKENMRVMDESENENEIRLINANSSFKVAYFYRDQIDVCSYFIHLKEHACLTSVEGLEEYHRYLASLFVKRLQERKSQLSLKDFLRLVETQLLYKNELGELLNEDEEHFVLNGKSYTLDSYIKEVAVVLADTYKYDLSNVIHLYAKYFVASAPFSLKRKE